ncbi:MAG TPA: Ig-like domain-containing protein, partial [Algoriphagus sp.]|nr:Ig-like domain-containing protein [Algoriphagus sp.]
VTYTVPTENAGSYAYTARYIGAGSNGYNESASDPVTVEVIECGGCEESFTYVNNGDGTYTFTYIPDSDMDDAELVFTFAQGIAMEGLADWSTKGQTKQKVMDLVECEEYSWTVTLDCKSNPGAQNLWTDFKVNEVSKKGTLSNIKCN